MKLSKINFDFHENHKTLELVDVEGSNFFEKWSRVGNYGSDTLKDPESAVRILRNEVPGLAIRNHSRVEQFGKFSPAYFEFYEFKSIESKELAVAIFMNNDGLNGGDTRLYATEEGKRLLESIEIETW